MFSFVLLMAFHIRWSNLRKTIKGPLVPFLLLCVSRIRFSRGQIKVQQGSVPVAVVDQFVAQQIDEHTILVR